MIRSRSWCNSSTGLSIRRFSNHCWTHLNHSSVVIFQGKTSGAFWVYSQWMLYGCWPRQDESEKTLSTLQSKNAELLGKVVRWWIWALIYSSRPRILESLFENKGGKYPFWSDSWVGPVVSLTFKCGCVGKSWATSPCCICHSKFGCMEMLFLVLKPWKKLGPLVVSSFLGCGCQSTVLDWDWAWRLDRFVCCSRFL